MPANDLSKPQRWRGAWDSGTQPPPTLLLREAEGRGTARWWPARLTGPGLTSLPSGERESEACGVSRAEPLGHHHAALSRAACGGCGLGRGPEPCQGQCRTVWPARPVRGRFPHLSTQNEHRLQMSFIPQFQHHRGPLR